MKSEHLIRMFGGAFCLPHNDHLEIVHNLLGEPKKQTVAIVPSGRRMDKQYRTSDEHRKKMVLKMWEELAAAYGAHVVFLDWEIDSSAVIHTVQTLSRLKNIAENLYGISSRVQFVTGSDNVVQNPQWLQDVQKQFEILVYPRAGYDVKPSRNVSLLNFAPLHRSSGNLIDTYLRGESIYNDVPHSVLRYLEMHNVFGKEISQQS